MSRRKNVQQKKHQKDNDTHTAKQALRSEPKGVNSMIIWLTVLVFVLPILFSRVTLDPNIAVRYIFFSVFILLFAVYFFFYKKITFAISNLPKNVFILSIGLGIWTIVSLFFARYPSAGYYEIARHFINIIFLFIVYAAVQNEQSKILTVCKAVLVMSLIQSLVGISQYYKLAFEDLPGADARPFGLMSNRNLFGSAQAYLLPFILFVLYKASKPWKYIGIIAGIGIILSVIVSETRSAWLATIIILISSLLLVLIFSPENRKKWLTGAAISTALIVLSVMVILTTDTEKKLTEKLTGVTQISSNISGDVEEESANERLKTWGKTVSLIKDHPVFGVGKANWKISIFDYGTADIPGWAKGVYVPTRAHNLYLEVAGETGIPGLILYAGIWILIAVIGFKIIISPVNETQRILIILMLSGLAGFASDSMFSFPTERIEHSLYILLMSGIILGSYTIKNTEHKQTARKILVPLLIITVLNIYMGYKKYSFDNHMYLAIGYNNESRYQEAIDAVEAGKTNLITINQTGMALEQYSSLAYDGLKDYGNAAREMNTALKYNPNNASAINNLGTFYTAMKKYDSAVISFQRAVKISPSFDAAYQNLAVSYFYLGNYQACLAALGKIKKQEDSVLIKNLTNDAKSRLALQSK